MIQVAQNSVVRYANLLGNIIFASELLENFTENFFVTSVIINNMYTWPIIIINIYIALFFGITHAVVTSKYSSSKVYGYYEADAWSNVLLLMVVISTSYNSHTFW